MTEIRLLDGALRPGDEAAVLEMARRLGAYRPSTYRPPPGATGPPLRSGAWPRRHVRGRGAAQPAATSPQRGFAPELGSRPDASRNFLRTGGRLGRTGDTTHMLSARTNYFRATYAISARSCAPAAESMLRNPTLLDAARALYGREAVTPFLLYANLLVPGQELGLHTDVPAYRDVSPAMVPGWLLVVMRHSGRFEDRRIPIATAVVYFGESQGGNLALYPDGADSDVVTLVPRDNAYVTFDADSVFHGVDRLDGDATPLRHLGSNSQLLRSADDTWTLSHGDGFQASYGGREVRFSVSWKAYCYADASEKTASHKMVSLGSIIETLVDELCDRGRLPGVNHGLSDVELGRLLIDEFVRFPAPTPGPSAGTNESRRARSGH